MNTLKHLIFLLVVSLSGVGPAQAKPDDEAPVTIVPQFGYEVKSNGVSEAVVYLEFAGEESSNKSARALVESTCNELRKVGQTSSVPTFDDGGQDPSKTRRITILAKHMSYFLSQSLTYNKLPGASIAQGVKGGLCAEHFRLRVQTDVTIRKLLPDRIIESKFNVEAKTGRNSTLRPGAMVNFKTSYGLGYSRGILKPGQGTGMSEVLGLPCVVVPSPLNTPLHFDEGCYASADNEKVPKIMEGRSLRQTATWEGSEKNFSRQEAVKLVPNGLIDSGVFEVPPGMTMREYTDPGFKAAK